MRGLMTDRRLIQIMVLDSEMGSLLAFFADKFLLPSPEREKGDPGQIAMQQCFEFSQNCNNNIIFKRFQDLI